jgi:hypothetical protein
MTRKEKIMSIRILSRLEVGLNRGLSRSEVISSYIISRGL